MTFTFTMDAFPGKTKNNPNKKVLCEINVLDTIYDPDDEANEYIDLALAANGSKTEVTILSDLIPGATYKYAVGTAAIDAETIGSAVTGTYTNAHFNYGSDKDFDFTTSSNTHIRVIAVKDSKVVAQSDDKAIPTA